jgi:hypothetical protein
MDCSLDLNAWNRYKAYLKRAYSVMSSGNVLNDDKPFEERLLCPVINN